MFDRFFWRNRAIKIVKKYCTGTTKNKYSNLYLSLCLCLCVSIYISVSISLTLYFSQACCAHTHTQTHSLILSHSFSSSFSLSRTHSLSSADLSISQSQSQSLSLSHTHTHRHTHTLTHSHTTHTHTHIDSQSRWKSWFVFRGKSLDSVEWQSCWIMKINRSSTNDVQRLIWFYITFISNPLYQLPLRGWRHLWMTAKLNVEITTISIIFDVYCSSTFSTCNIETVLMKLKFKRIVNFLVLIEFPKLRKI